MAIFICTDTRVCRCSLSFLSKDQQERGGSTDYSSSGNWHEAANAFHDRYPKDNIHDLAADISAKGLLNTIVLLDRKAIDGRNRALAFKEAGVKPNTVEWKHNEVSPIAWVISLNLTRRHLTAPQRECVAVDAKVLYAADGKRPQQVHAKTAPGKKKHVSQE
jgi:hypothetical protein